ncbi:lysocardiolipin acyltransferase 1 [Strongylocentrotus purpuratus]|uniref:Phospholipid/glycerol acyltransferase domain-containing protein n=1 Tax=Strongylocentrotus purpuratus TaxID=7668 RepID=A0A7M7T5C2_STRPU|nr:lysocardiolipin acyltransferase 1 [Strongylocentrotus purpuratus]
MGGILNNRFGGFIFMTLLWFTAFFGSMLMMGPLIPLMFIRPLAFRYINDNLMALWLTLPVLLNIFGVKCRVSGDKLNKSETSVIIMNHRTRLDWMFFWIPLFSLSSVRSEKIILKNELKFVPGPGWAMQIASYVFLRRRWEQDKAWMTMMLDYFCDIQYNVQYLIFPEGTDYTDHSKDKSDSYATKNNLPKYEYVLHPRTTGFKHIMDHLRKRQAVDAIYDVTVAYPDRIPVGGELDIFKAKLPNEVHYHVKRYDISSLPQDTDYEEWCVERWKEKEVELRGYYTGDKKFVSGNSTGDGLDGKIVPGMYRTLFVALIYWVLFILFMVCLLVYTSIAWWHMLAVGLFFTGTSVFYGGVEKLAIDAYYWHVGWMQPADKSS